MTSKEKVVRMVERLDSGFSFQQLMFQITLLRGIDIGQEPNMQSNPADFEGVCYRLEREWKQSDLRPPTGKEIDAAFRAEKRASKNSGRHDHAKSA
jgi:hypothetical protein